MFGSLLLNPKPMIDELLTAMGCKSRQVFLTAIYRARDRQIVFAFHWVASGNGPTLMHQVWCHNAGECPVDDRLDPGLVRVDVGGSNCGC